MKKVIFIIAILVGLAGTAAAQTSSEKMKAEKPKKEMKMKMKMKEGVAMMNNKLMMCKDNKCTPLTSTYNFTNGSKISVNGTVTKADGSTMKLKNGYEMNMNGEMAMIPHGEKGHVCGPDCPMYKKM